MSHPLAPEDLLWVAVPNSALKDLRSLFEAKGGLSGILCKPVIARPSVESPLRPIMQSR